MKTCPGMESLAAFADGSISGPERERIESHLASCDRCRSEALALARALEPAAPSAPAGLGDRIVRRMPRPKEGRRMNLRIMAAAAVFGLLILGISMLGGPQPPLENPRREMVLVKAPAVPINLGGPERSGLRTTRRMGRRWAFG